MPTDLKMITLFKNKYNMKTINLLFGLLFSIKLCSIRCYSCEWYTSDKAVVTIFLDGKTFSGKLHG